MTGVNEGGTDHPDLSGRSGADALARLYDLHARELHRYLARRLDPASADDLVACAPKSATSCSWGPWGTAGAVTGPGLTREG